MKNNLKFQLTKLQKKESEIERATYELARSIFANHVHCDWINSAYKVD